MKTIEFYRIGNEPFADAIRLKNLYSSDGIDDAITREFDTTVAAYRSLAVEDIRDRIRTKYAADPAIIAGELTVVDSHDAAMAIAGQKPFLHPKTGQSTEGINVSAWVLAQYRGAGIGKLIAHHMTEVAAHTFPNQTIWTSIHTDNMASRKAFESAGYRVIGSQLDEGKQDRIIYLRAG